MILCRYEKRIKKKCMNLKTKLILSKSLNKRRKKICIYIYILPLKWKKKKKKPGKL